MTEEIYKEFNAQQLENTRLLTAVDIKLKVLLWALGVLMTVFFAPAIAYVIHLESRVQTVEHSVTVIITQRNLDHPTKDKLPL